MALCVICRWLEKPLVFLSPLFYFTLKTFRVLFWFVLVCLVFFFFFRGVEIEILLLKSNPAVASSFTVMCGDQVD